MPQRTDRLSKAIIMNTDDSFQKLVEVMDPGQPNYKKDGPPDYYIIRLGRQKAVSIKEPKKKGLK